MMRASIALLFVSGCFFDFGEDEPSRPAPPPPPPVEAPQISISVPPWPPLGPDSTIAVETSHPRGLGQLTASFARSRSIQLSGTHSRVELSGGDLGEGYGRADIEVGSVDGRRSSAFISDLLIDLTPPKIEAAGPLLLRPGQAFRVTASDAWILGGARIEIGARNYDAELDPGFPATFGRQWDVAEFEATVRGDESRSVVASVEIHDAAGNTVEESFTIQIDATPPTVAILSPVEGSTVADSLELAVSGDDAEGSTWIDLSLEGTPIGEVAGPNALLTVDLSAFPRGPLRIQAVARDAAGHESTPASLVIEKN